MSGSKISGSGNTSFWNRLATLGVAGQAALLSAVVLAGWFLVAPLAYSTSGPMGLAAALIGAGACWLGAILALLLVSLFPDPRFAVYGLAGGMFSRTMLPLLIGTLLHFKVPALADAGMIYYLLGFYLATLAIETLLLLAKIPAPNVPATNRRVM